MNASHLLEAKSRDLGHEMVAKGAIYGRGGTFRFFEKSGNHSVERSPISVKAQPFFREKACLNGKEAGVELYVETSPVQRGECKVPERQRDLVVRQHLTEASKSLT